MEKRSIGYTRLVLADETPQPLDFLRRLLVLQGCSVTVVHDADALLAAARKERPDAAVVEPNLRGGHWYRLLHELARLVQPCAIVVVTAHPSAALRAECAALGVLACLAKPVAPEAVCRSVMEPLLLLGRSSRSRPRRVHP
jgi:DNA-binding NarL/FixJ family response regulator